MKTISTALLPEFEQEMANTRKILERVPEGKFDFKPHEKSMALGWLAGHVAEISGWAGVALTQDVFEMDENFKPFIPVTRAEVLDTFEKGVQQSREAIERATDEDFAKIWTFKFGGKTIMSLTKSVVIRTTVINHLIHHRAQLGVYLRLNEVELPGMYGASADEDKFWEPKKA